MVQKKVKSRKKGGSNYQAMIKTRRTVELTPLAITAADVKAGYALSLDNLPGYAALTSVFDEYRFEGITFKFISGSRVNYWETGGPAAVELPVLMTAVDYDDSSAPASKDAVLQYDSCVVSDVTRVVTRFVKPKVSATYWQNALSAGFGSASGRWLDCSSAGIEHYGLKCCLSPGASTVDDGMKIRVFATVDLELRRTL